MFLAFMRVLGSADVAPRKLAARDLSRVTRDLLLVSCNVKPVTGTYDYYFDIADQLQKLDATFLLVIVHSSGEGALTLSNVRDKKTAQVTINHLCETFEERGIIPNPDEDDADEDNTDPAI